MHGLEVLRAALLTCVGRQPTAHLITTSLEPKVISVMLNLFIALRSTAPSLSSNLVRRANPTFTWALRPSSTPKRSTMAPATTPTRTVARRASSRSAAESPAASSSTTSPVKPKRKASESSSSRAKEATEDDSAAKDELAASEAATPAKKPRKKTVSDSDSPSAPKSEDTTADPSLPKNTEMPASLSYARPSAPGSVRITSWNITSLKSSEPKGMMRYLEAEDADIVVLSETKVNDAPMHPGLTKIYKHQYWGIGKQKGYAGLAILSKIQPVKAVYGLPGLKEQDTKGRIGEFFVLRAVLMLLLLSCRS
ncbi:DNA lyase [Pseudozyma hubeiensis SY62]|uniref:DNA lyase n=1 Tax=Pseudozyma hubeiensis (strain SY62) TaxID=1305764 RepID=R9P8F7_PSEHS|nr:DNA lyase [Pseudozyma hubeiensis SY62]GAC94340.1 DNA lyase [Pseudozyma hubeiensis SY62]